jgi:galactose mutarotase-like enzyme
MMDLAGVPYMTLWSNGGPFLCVEPCWGLPDAHEQRAFEQKEGIQTIPPGGELRACFSVTPQFASCD